VSAFLSSFPPRVLINSTRNTRFPCNSCKIVGETCYVDKVKVGADQQYFFPACWRCDHRGDSCSLSTRYGDIAQEIHDDKLVRVPRSTKNSTKKQQRSERSARLSWTATPEPYVILRKETVQADDQ